MEDRQEADSDVSFECLVLSFELRKRDSFNSLNERRVRGIYGLTPVR